MNVDSFRRRVMDVFLGKPCHQILTNDTVKSPTFVASGDFLPHGCQKALRVEEASDPKYLKVMID